MLKHTALTDIHDKLGAKMVEFAGYSMPLYYSDIISEHLAVRDHVGLFDVSHMGEFMVTGEQSTALVSHVTSNDPNTLAIGQAQYSCLPNHAGGIIDDLLVYRLEDDHDGFQKYMLVVNASNIDKDFGWINEHNTFKATCTNNSDQISLLALQGPKAHQLLSELIPENVDLKYYHFRKYEMAGVPNVLVSATGYTGSGGYELYIHNDSTQIVWNALSQLIPKYKGLHVGLGARDTLRIEKGFCLYGNDINYQTSPLEAGLGWITKLEKENFIGKEAILEHKKLGTKKKLIGFKIMGRRVARPGYNIVIDSKIIGQVTSGCISPCLGHPIAMGYVEKKYANGGTKLSIDTGRKLIEAEVVKIPFV